MLGSSASRRQRTKALGRSAGRTALEAGFARDLPGIIQIDTQMRYCDFNGIPAWLPPAR
jgi:hypothetical protein